MAFTLTVNGVDRTSKTYTDTIEMTTARMGTPDTFSFSLDPEDPSDNIKPLADEVVVFKKDSTVLFEGRVLNVGIRIESKEAIFYDVECQDYTRDALKGELIAEIYREQTVNYIIDDIITRYPQFSAFNDDNVDCTIEIDYGFFDHLTLPAILRDLASRVGYDFYIDENKSIHFFLPETEIAPFSITESNGMFLQDSFNIVERGDKIVNMIIVEGGEYTANIRNTEPFTADGTQTEFDMSDRYAEVNVEVATVSKTVGTYSIHDPADYDCLYDYNARKIIFRDDNKPTVGQAVDISGFKKLVVKVQVDEPVSIGNHGTISRKITKKSLKTPTSARQYAFSELQKFSIEGYSGSFVTRGIGLRAAQRITISHAAINFSKDFYIQTTSTRKIGQQLETVVNIASADEIDGVGLLARLLNNESQSESAEEVLDVAKFIFENVSCASVLTVDGNKETIEETVDLAETVDSEINKTITWVLPPYAPTSFSDPKRAPLLDWSSATLS